jgi:hypothetical protein
MHRMVDEAWVLLEKIFENIDSWDLDKGNKPTMEFGYKYVEIFYVFD